jgi:hypothetical protein
VKQVYKPKEKEEVQKMKVDPERTTSQDIIQIGSTDVQIGDDGKRLIVPNNKVVTSTPGVFAATNDHEANGSGSNSKYLLPRWCPPRLTRTQRRKLQRLRFQEKREKELEKQRDEAFNQYKPMVPRGKEWRVKTSSQLALVRLVEGSVSPVDVDGQADDLEMPPSFSSSVPMVCDDKFASDPAPEDDEELVLTPKFGTGRSLICGSNPVKRSVREKEDFFRKIRQRSPRSAICFRSAGKLFALILWDCAMTWPERKGRMDG